ncbi:MAG TPA: aryl-sulfate sulfotransferase [Acidimicrobiia bacterium]|jgi:hypothetical protein
MTSAGAHMSLDITSSEPQRRLRDPFVAFVTVVALSLASVVAASAAEGASTRATATSAATADLAWAALGGSVTADPSAALDPQDPSSVYTFVRGSDGGLYWQHTTGDSSSSGAGGGFLTSQPTVVVDRTGVSGNVGIYAFVRGGDGALYAGRVSGSGEWEGWEALGGYLDFFPGATVDSTGVWVGVRGGDGALYARRLLGGTWSPWMPLGGFLTSAPSMTGDASGVYAFVSGPDDALWVRNLSGGDWLGLGGDVTSGPVATTDATGISVLVRGGDGGAYRRHESGGVWAAYESLGGFLTSAPVAVADTSGVSVYMRGADGGLYRNRFDGGSWHDWIPLGGYLASAPTAVADGAGFDDVFVVGGDAGLYTMSVEGAAIGGPPLITSDPGLFPAFSAGVHDYVSRCSASAPVQVSVVAPAGTTVSVDGQLAASGSFTAAVTRDVGQSFAIVVAGLQPADTYYVRCLPADFPTWTVQQYAPTQAEYYVLGGAFAKYVAIVDTNGVPVWWDVPPSSAVFAQLLPDGKFGWITGQNGAAQELPLTGSPVQTIAASVPGASAVDNHEFLQLPNGHHVVVVNRAVPDVDLSAWGPGFTTGTVLDHVIEELDANGNVVWSWDTIGHIPVTETDAQWRGTTTGCFGVTCQDAYHWNSIEPIIEPNGDPGFVINYRHTDAAYNIDQTTGSIVWRLGGVARRSTSADGTTTSASTTVTAADGAFAAADVGLTISDSLGLIPAGTRITAVSSPTTAVISQGATGTSTTDVLTTNPESLTVQGDPVFSAGSHFGGQHDPRVLSDGTVTLYDDGTGLDRPPRAVRYQIDRVAMTATLVEQVNDPSLVSNSSCCGSARKLSGGDWVVGWGGNNYVSEMTPTGSRVFLLRITSGAFVYRAVPVPFGVLDRNALRADMDQNGSLAVSAATVAPGSPPPPGYP